MRRRFDDRTEVLVAGIALAVLTVVAYLPALHAGFVFDDEVWVTAPATWRELSGLWRVWFEPSSTPQYYPLSYTTLWLEYHVWGLQPLGYHLVNVCLHALGAVLLWQVLRALQVRGAWMAAAVFAVHPMNVETVAWVTERKNLLSAVFSLSAVLLFWKRIKLPEQVGWGAYGGVTALFVAALLSKSVACTLPIVIALLVYWKDGQVPRRIAWLLAPLMAAGLCMAAMTVWLEAYHAGPAGTAWTLSWPERLLVAGRAFWFYPRTLLWPHPLAVIYPRWIVDLQAWQQLLYPLAAAATIAGLFAARRRIGTGILVATLCYAVLLAPTSGFFDVAFMTYSFVADHFAYMPAIPLIAVGTAAGTALLQRLGSPAAAAVTAAVVLLGLSVLTAMQCEIYRSPRAFWTDALAKNPDCWLAHNNLGGIAAREGHTDEAIAHYEQALRLQPSYVLAHFNLGVALESKGQMAAASAEYVEALRQKADLPEAHERLGETLAAQGRIAEAISEYREALRLRNTDEAEAHNVIGNSLQKFGQLDAAIAEYQAAVRRRPDYAEAHNNLGRALVEQGRVDEGLAHLEQAVSLKPDYAMAQYNLGTVLIGLRRIEAAKAHFIAAIAARPDYAEAHNNLGYLLYTEGRTGEAIAEYEATLRLKPDYPEAQTNLALALATQGKLAEAIAHYEAALRLKADHAAAHRGLGLALARDGQRARAITELEAALRLNPDDDESRRQLEQLQRDNVR